MFMQTVIEAVSYFLLPKFTEDNTTDCCQTERQTQRDAWGSAVSLNNALHVNCLQMIQKRQWPP